MGDLALAIKQMQRTNPEGKEAWIAFCDAYGGGNRDPNRHDTELLETFFAENPQFMNEGSGGGAPVRPSQKRPAAMMSVGKGFSPSKGSPSKGSPSKGAVGGKGGYDSWGGKGGFDMWAAKGGKGGYDAWGGGGKGGYDAWSGGGGGMDLGAFVKFLQKSSHNFKECWQVYCQTYGGSINDPARHDPDYITSFFDFIASEGKRAMGPGAGYGGYGGGAPVAKRQKQLDNGGKSWGKGGGGKGGGGGGDDPMKAELVSKIKDFQRSGQDAKEQWWSHCDTNLGGVRDPNRHTAEVLQAFIEEMGC